MHHHNHSFVWCGGKVVCEMKMTAYRVRDKDGRLVNSDLQGAVEFAVFFEFASPTRDSGVLNEPTFAEGLSAPSADRLEDAALLLEAGEGHHEHWCRELKRWYFEFTGPWAFCGVRQRGS